MITLTSALRTAIATGVLLLCGAGTALAATNAVTFADPGEYPIVIPNGVTSLKVVAVGGSGGEGTYGVPGGFGARVTANLPVTGGATRDPQSGAYRATSPFDLAVGTYTAVAAQADDVGNEAATAARTFAVDGTTAVAPPIRADGTKPVLSRVSLSPARFKVGTAKTALTASAAKALKRGTSVRYTLSESATVTLAIARSGQRKAVGTITRRSKTGANRIAFSGRLGAKALKPGRYVLTLTAVDAAGNRSAAKKVSFRIG